MNKETITVSAPAKLFLLGEHFVVYGVPALLTSVGLRSKVTLTPTADRGITIISRNLNADLTQTPDEILQKRALAEEQWTEFNKVNDVSILSGITAKPLDYATIAIGEAIKHYGRDLPSGFGIEIYSDVPIGAGLGSSAATSVTLVAAVALFLGEKLDPEVINNIAYEAEKRRHGNPSGADNSTVTFGGVIRFVRDPKIIDPLGINIPDELARNFVLIDTGKPNESTGEMVAKVRVLREKNPDLVNQTSSRQAELVESLIPAVKTAQVANFMQIIKAGERNLEAIEVVSDSSLEIIKAIEASGGVAKICGAGGKSGPTGILLAYHPDRNRIEELMKSSYPNLHYFSAPLGVEGLRQEAV